jgi:hypothetical protein
MSWFLTNFWEAAGRYTRRCTPQELASRPFVTPPNLWLVLRSGFGSQGGSVPSPDRPWRWSGDGPLCTEMVPHEQTFETLIRRFLFMADGIEAAA